MFNADNGTLQWDQLVDPNLLCVAGVAFSSNGAYFVNAEETGNLELYAFNNGNPVLERTISTNTSTAYSVAFSPNSELLVTGCDNVMRTYQRGTGTLVQSINAHNGLVLGVAWSSNGLYVASCGSDGLLKLWTTTGSLLRTMTVSSGYCFSVAFTPDDRYLVTGGQDNQVKLWDVQTGALLRTYTGHNNNIRQVAVSPNGLFVASASLDQTVRIWELHTGTFRGALFNSGSGGLYSLSWSPTASRIAAGALNNQVIVWNTSSLTAPPTSVRVRAFLDGPYQPGSQTMSGALSATGLLPSREPYSLVPPGLVLGGGERLPANAIPAGRVDWVVVELRSAADPGIIIESRAFTVEQDGDVVDHTAGTTLGFAAPPGAYHVSIRHRNHLGVRTASPITLGSAPVLLDLTLPATAVHGNAPRRIVGTRATLWAGDSTGEGTVKYAGSGNDRDPVLQRIGGTVPTSTTTGYWREDVTLDGLVKYAGSNNDRDPILQTVGGSVPTATRVQQLP